ncbi:unnamed protein product [Protopolystoma xenopodis]|uniref:Uncharacterized protein n=1 Tax=Protopolystoma xenopodis TaxID=117903 RepID=A0A448WL96_9PLAT|nr:unnamed protein product [Protopolystoma xenopodis]
MAGLASSNARTPEEGIFCLAGQLLLPRKCLTWARWPDNPAVDPQSIRRQTENSNYPGDCKCTQDVVKGALFDVFANQLSAKYTIGSGHILIATANLRRDNRAYHPCTQMREFMIY